MPSPFTRTMELSRQLLRFYQTEGREAFATLLKEHAQALVNETGEDVAALNSRFLTLISGMLAVFYGTNTDEIIRRQVALSERFSAPNDPREKAEAFTRAVLDFLQRYEEEQKRKGLVDLVMYRLSTCSLKELRMITVSSLAEKFSYHPNYLSAKFRREGGSRLNDAIVSERLSRAYFLLREERHLGVQDVAQQVGFTDTKHFGAIFRKRFGMAPSQVPGRAGPVPC